MDKMEMTRVLFEEINSYIERTNDYSYYNLKAELIQTKPDVAEILKFRTPARCAADYMKEKKREAGAQYSNTKIEAYDRYVDVLAELDEKAKNDEKHDSM